MEMVKEFVEKGWINFVFVESLKLTPEESLHSVLKDLKERNVGLVVIDSLNGFELALEGNSKRPWEILTI